MAGLLDQLEIEIADRLTSIPFFANLTIHAEPQKNIVEEVAHKVAKIRTLIAPFVSAADDTSPNVPTPWFENIQIDVGVFQNPTIAAADPHPREICENIFLALKSFQPASLSNVITPRTPGITYQARDGALNTWNCAFTVKGGLMQTLPKVATPTTAVAAGNVTLACATAGAAMFYTVDGSAPTPAGGALYAAPFASAGQTVRARAFLAGYLNSDFVKLTT